MTAPGDLGLGRAYVTGDLVVTGVHPGDPYDGLKALQKGLKLRRPSPPELVKIVSGLGVSHLKPPPPPKEETLPRWRRVVEGVRHSRTRDKEAIHHHYDVSNTFYEFVLGPSMTYTCAVYPTDDATLEQAQHYKYDLVARKLGLEPGMRLLDVGCGWGGMVRHAAQHYGVKALGVTLSREQADVGAGEDQGDGPRPPRRGASQRLPRGRRDRLRRRQLDRPDRAHRRARTTRRTSGSCATGCAHRRGCSTTASPARTTSHQETGAFIDRYVFPDGELTGSGKIITEVQNVGLEVQHEENLRVHYARTLAGWCRNLEENWDACVAEVGEGTARVWGLYMAGSRLGFERNEIQLHHVLATKTDDAGHDGYPLRPTFAEDATYPA